MYSIVLSDTSYREHSSRAFIFFLQADFSFDSLLQSIASEYIPYLEQYFKEKKFTGKWNQAVTIPVYYKDEFCYFIFVGLGNPKSEILEYYRRSVGKAIRIVQGLKVESVSMVLPDHTSIDLAMLVKTTVVTTGLTLYAFDDYLTKKEDAVELSTVTIIIPRKITPEIQAIYKQALVIQEAVNNTRKLVDLPANVINPTTLAEKGVEIAKKHHLKVTVFKDADIVKMGMGGLHAVGMGSEHEPHLVIMEYKTDVKNAPTIAIVGKGITFDSGGLNIKPTGYMEDMKDDMSGAAAVMNTICAIADLKAHVNVIAVAPLAENMVSGSANHPGDYLRFYNGKTAIVGNTDAEGRLVLADALSYVEKNYTPDVIIDLATLTGACVHAVGPFFSGLLTQNEELATELQQLGVTSGDALWRLPFIDLYKKMVETPFADASNDGKGKYKAGATNGACFLSHFVEKTPWAHIDIAPTAFDIPDTPYYQSGGATGAGVRLLIDFIMNYKA